MLIGFGLVVVIPLVAILLHHQRKMAELVTKRSVEAQDGLHQQRIALLEQRVEELGHRLNESILRADSQPTRPPARESDDLSQRLNG